MNKWDKKKTFNKSIKYMYEINFVQGKKLEFMGICYICNNKSITVIVKTVSFN